MTRGLSRQQIGVTEAMIASWGDIILKLSHNYQFRRGDPVRELNWAEIERQREGTGLSDPEIANKLGLTRDQVTYIRVISEHRRFRRRPYHRLFELGGGRRFRSERFVAHEDRKTFSDDALALRNALAFRAERAAFYLQDEQWTADTVASLLTTRTNETPDATAIGNAEGFITYSDLHDRSLRLANSLLELGIQKGDVLAIQLPNTPEFMTAYLAAAMIGAVVSTLHMPYRSGEMEPLLQHSRARAVLCGAATENYDAPAVMRGLRDRISTLSHIIVAGDGSDHDTFSLTTLVEGGTAAPVADPPVASDPAIVCFTSGTAAAPKAVVHNYHTLLSNNQNAAPLYGLGPDDVVLGLPPFTHAFGICILNFTLRAGASSLLCPAFSPPVLLDLIENNRPTVLFAAPAHIAACSKSGLLNSGDLSSLRLATISGSPCPPEVAYALEEAMPNGKVGQMWGMSECFMGLHTPFDAPASIRCESLGSPTPNFEIRIADNGELEIRGSSVISGYFDNDEANRDAFTDDGWFRTGDLAERRGADDVRITGRVKDIVNRGGIKINPTDVEAVISRHPAVAVCAIAPIPDDVLGEKACAYIELQDDASLTLDTICQWLRDKDVAKMKWPEALEIVDTMPMTPTRKVAKGELRRR